MDTLTNIQAYYRRIPKPTKFGNPDHCSECAEHNETLSSHTPDTISLKELGNPGWDPICYINSINQFRYYLPAFARLSCGTGDDYYLGQFLFHLNEERIQELTMPERFLLADHLDCLAATMPAEIECNLDASVLSVCVMRLRASA